MARIGGPERVDIFVGARISLRRSALGLSQTALAQQLGVSFQQVQKYEKGTNRVGASRLQDIASILSAPVSYFFENAPSKEASAMPVHAEEPANAMVMEFCSSAEGLTLNRAFVKISSPKTRKRIIELVRALADEQAG